MKGLDNKYIDDILKTNDKWLMKTEHKGEDRSALQGVFDKFTYETIENLRNKGIIKEFIGILKTGKEANVYCGIGKNGQIAIKIYKIGLLRNIKWMNSYIIGDPRFHNVSKNAHKIIFTWCKKEFKNLNLLQKHNITVPEPISQRNNVLIMRFIAEENGTPARLLKDFNTLEDPRNVFDQIIEKIKEMFQKAHLVHGDLSEYNILFFHKELIIIDVSQSVLISHPYAIGMLRRDIYNIYTYFTKFLGDENLPSIEELYEYITESSKNMDDED